MVKTNINGKYELYLPEHRAIRPEWNINNGGWEYERMESIHEHVRKKDVFYYIGAEEADLAGLICKWGAGMVLVEPNSKVWPNSKVIWEANQLQDPLACFVGFAANKTDLKGTNLTVYGFPECADGPVIGDHGFKELFAEADVIPQIKIDDIVAQTELVPDHISVDCEGSDWEVLKGAEQTLKEHKPKLWISIHPEFMFRMFNQYAYDFRNWIKDLGYNEKILDYKHELHCFYAPR